MSGGYFSPLAWWIGGAGAAAEVAADAGYRSLGARWIGGVSAPAEAPSEQAGYRSLAALWLGGAAVPGSTPPPPSGDKQFTVSGGWVCMTFEEFFLDVVLTDAAITKRTN